MPGSNAVVTIELADMISMSAKEIAREVGDELRTKEIEPLRNRIEAVHNDLQDFKTKTSNKVSWITGAKDTIFKLGWVALAIIEGAHYLRH